MASIDRTEVQAWVAGIDRAASTVSDIHSVFASILDDAMTQKRIPTKAARGVKLPKRTRLDHNYLTHVQVAQLVAEFKHPEIVRLLPYSGCRWGEMAALRPRDVGLDRRMRPDHAVSLQGEFTNRDGRQRRTREDHSAAVGPHVGRDDLGPVRAPLRK